MMTSLVHSQTLSNDKCVIPCSTLKNALKIKVQHDYCFNQLTITRDSILLMNSISLQKDSIISNKNKEIILLEKNIIEEKKIATVHEQKAIFYKEEADKQTRLKMLSFGGGILSVVLSILFL